MDPVLTRSFPAGLALRPLKGTDPYRPEDLPPIDYLLITHDHWDHLDWGTLKALRNTVGKVLCPLGVGAHLRRWGYSRNQIVELDWNEQYAEASLHITCLPARHFSGRMLKRNTSLWASFMVQGGKTVYVGGDSGFGKHYAHIAQRFPHIDLAIVENGQYNPAWAHIHTFPHELVEVVRILRPGLAIPVHNSKYVLAPHAPDEPRDLLRQALTADPKLPLVFPTPGHALYF